ncbi:ROK family transcriptional regulator [Lichenihabitans psoromatis]|uniref:ROK family transcriptional regulator n=1 Tax=Lichenihabitans psoromatis TaxID=2528642 RepID=UPI0013F17331|nr:ROK family transcriptional regulator [Lichenihabitans psoromatis]
MSTSLKIAGSNLEHVQTHNRRVVLDAIRRAGALTRAEVARRTHLTAQTVNNIVSVLHDTGLVSAGAPNRGGRGQPSIPYSIDPEGAWSLGFHVDHRSISGAVVDFTGRIRGHKRIPADQPSPTQAADALARMAAPLLKRAGAVESRILGAGLAVPVRFNAGSITSAGPTTLPGWDEGDAADMIEAALGMAVLIENDAVAAAIGERLNGLGREIDSYVYLFMNDGLGAGIMIEGQPWRGTGRNAGEIGHMIVVPDGRPCPCGNHGCLERYVSLSAVYENLGIAPPDATPEFIAHLETSAPGRLDAWVKDAAPRLAQAIGILESAFDPQTVILGGVAPKSVLERLVAALALPVSVGSRASRTLPRVMLGRTGPEAPLLGAASLPIFDEVSPRFDVLLKNG